MNQIASWVIYVARTEIKAAERKGGGVCGEIGAIFPGSHFARGPRWGPCYIIRDWNTLIEKSPSCNNISNTEINCWNCSQIQSQRSDSQKFPAIREFLYNKYCKMTPT